MLLPLQYDCGKREVMRSSLLFSEFFISKQLVSNIITSITVCFKNSRQYRQFYQDLCLSLY